MKSYRFSFFFAIVFLLLNACGSDAGQSANQSPSTAPADNSASGAVSDDAATTGSSGNLFDDNQYTQALLKLVAGKWQNQTTSGQTIEFAGNKIRYFTNDKLTREATIEIDPRCETADCKGNIGWCMIEKEGGSSSCKVVTRVDAQNLVFYPANDQQAETTFLKVVQ